MSYTDRPLSFISLLPSRMDPVTTGILGIACGMAAIAHRERQKQGRLFPMDANHLSDARKGKRSRSPYRHDGSHVKRHRSRSPRDRKKQPPAKLPFRQQPITKHDFEAYKPLFAEYLDIQKRIDIDDLPDYEVKGRWKSFLKKWNEAELSEGWYDPEMGSRASARWKTRGEKRKLQDEEDDDDEDDEYGPRKAPRLAGPSIPSLDDLEHRREVADEDRSARIADLRHERKQDRNLQKERLEEMAPRADLGSRERQLEKKRDTTVVNREFRDAKDSGDVEVGESELMGDDGVDAYKAKLKAQQKVKNEREIRKEENLRARMAEREERMAEHRKKEEKTMEMLRNIARQRFG